MAEKKETKTDVLVVVGETGKPLAELGSSGGREYLAIYDDTAVSDANTKNLPQSRNAPAKK